MPSFVPGQRWISQAEPELGLGTVLRCEGRSVQVYYAASNEMRHYATHSAPLSRAAFRPGDRVSSATGQRFVVEQVVETEGLFCYLGEGKELPEAQLDDIQAISQADERLKNGRVDANARFELRLEALQRRAAARSSPTWGFGSARIDLIPHQLRVAGIVSERRRPRVLLADEVGLGKTIEACLILHRLQARGRAARILVLLPESLVHQWFVELLRRFNLAFSIFDESRCEAIELADDGRNPFEDEQLVLTDLRFLMGSERRRKQLLAAPWDLLIVDEAHHLEWSPEHSSPEYQLVESLAQRCPGLILLTATPEQLGRTGHFARLRLLDADRFSDLAQYQQEAEGYVALSAWVDRLRLESALEPSEVQQLKEILAPEELPEHESPQQREQIVGQLVDRHGTGRVMYRHRRAGVGGFPKRYAEIDTLSSDGFAEGDSDRLLLEFEADVDIYPAATELDYSSDPRLNWLVDLIERLQGSKLLLICRSQAKVAALEDALRQRSGVGVARFHEGLGLAQRDRNAAWFADPEGARVLLCSEIGSEGRNFQFAHHLVMWDLPLDPDLLEQRIGRLDRIGQTEDIHIHHACVAGSAQAMLARWYTEGLNSFEDAPADGRELLRRFGPQLRELAPRLAHGDAAAEQAFEVLLQETQSHHKQLNTLLHQGRDRLLEVAAAFQMPGDPLVVAIGDDDVDLDRDDFVLRLLEQFGVQQEQTGPRTWLLDPEYASSDGLPGLDQGSVTVTFDRDLALTREELPFLRMEHPMVSGTLDLLLSSESGNATLLLDESLPARTVVLQCVFVLECIAPAPLDIERFLPHQPLLTSVNQRREQLVDYSPSVEACLAAGDRPIEGARFRSLLSKLIPPMVEAAAEFAEHDARSVRDAALQSADSELSAEIDRLQALTRINPGVDENEIAALQAERKQISELIPGARLRLDSLRFVFGRDFHALARGG